MVVVRVCQSWRQIALATPSLWRSIHIPPDFQHPGTMALAFFERSHPLPIDLDDRSKVQVEEEEESPKPVHEHKRMEQFYQTLMENVQRVRSLRMEGTIQGNAEVFLEKGLPSVTSLAVDLHCKPSLSLQFLASNLRRLSLKNLVELPSNQLTGLTHLYLSKGCRTFTLDLNVFLQLLDDLSRTLQVLFVSHIQLPISELSEFAGRVLVAPIVMEVLREVEVLQTDRSLITSTSYNLGFLHCLALPNITKIVWSAVISQNSKCIYQYPSAQSLLNITMARIRRSGEVDAKIIMDHETLIVPDDAYWDLYRQASIPEGEHELPVFGAHLPNLQVCEYSTPVRPQHLDFPSVLSIHTDMASAPWLIIALENPSSLRHGYSLNPEEQMILKPSFLANLSEVIIHTDHVDMHDEEQQKELSAPLVVREIPHLQLSDELTTKRNRPQRNTTYMLKFTSGTFKLPTSSSARRAHKRFVAAQLADYDFYSDYDSDSD